VIVVFLAILELIKAGQLVARQRGRFRDIMMIATEAATGVSP
jgi:chromatin segregation and condensation protein Rec8/ScpA/Scc1 (kleisin family)